MSVREISKTLRKQQTVEESMLWEELRNNKLGFKFRRQHPIGKYIVDFYCAKANLVIEIDGCPHKTLQRKIIDNFRSKYIESLGNRIIRFWGKQISKDMEDVLTMIKSKLPGK